MARREVEIEAGGARLHGTLTVPEAAFALAIFAHGSGSSRHSPRNQQVARAIQGAGIGTLLFDLLSAQEEAADRFTGHLRFDVELLASRLALATEWALSQVGELAVDWFRKHLGIEEARRSGHAGLGGTHPRA